MKNTINNLIVIVFLSAIMLWVSCGDSGTSAPDTFNIAGTWEVTSIEGAPAVNGSNSTWTFKADGTYDWFLLLLSFDVQAQGDYSLAGNTLTCTGFITTVCGTDKINLTISNNNNTFSMLDADGDRWIYNRMP